MTDREAAAGLVERLDNRIRVYEMTPNSKALDAELHRLSRAQITALLSELERVGKERDTLGKMTAPDAVVRLTETLLTVQNAAMDSIQRLAAETARANDLEARATKAEAFVAEAVRVCEPFAKRAGKLDGHWLDHETNWSPAYGSTEITIRDLRAARAFIEKAKS